MASSVPGSQPSNRRAQKRLSKRQPLQALSQTQFSSAANSNASTPTAHSPTTTAERRWSRLNTRSGENSPAPSLSGRQLPPQDQENDKSIRMVESLASIRYAHALKLDPTPDNSSAPNSASAVYPPYGHSLRNSNEGGEAENDENATPYGNTNFASSISSQLSSGSIYHKSPFPSHPAHILRPGQKPKRALRLDTLNTSSNPSLRSATPLGPLSTTSTSSTVSLAQSFTSTASFGSNTTRPTRRNRSRRSAQPRPADLKTDTSAKVAEALAFFSALSSRSEEELQHERDMERLREASGSQSGYLSNTLASSSDLSLNQMSSSVGDSSSVSRPTTAASNALALPLPPSFKGRDSAVRLSDVFDRTLKYRSEKGVDMPELLGMTLPANAENHNPVVVYRAAEPESENFSIFFSPGFSRPCERDLSSAPVSPKGGEQHPGAVQALDSVVGGPQLANKEPVDDHTIRMVSSVATFHGPRNPSAPSLSSIPSSPNVIVHAVSNSSLASSYSRWKGVGAKGSMKTLRGVDETEECLSDNGSEQMSGLASPNYLVFGSSSPVIEIHGTTENDLETSVLGAQTLRNENPRQPLSIWTGQALPRDSLPSSPPLPYAVSRTGSAANRYSIGNRLGSALGMTTTPSSSGVMMPVPADIRASVLSYVTNTVDTPLSAVNATWASDQLGGVLEKPEEEGNCSHVDVIQEVDDESDNFSHRTRRSVDPDTLSRLTAPSEVSVISVAVPMPLFFRRSAPPSADSINDMLAHSQSVTTLTTMNSCRRNSVGSIRSVKSMHSISSFADVIPEWARRYYSDGRAGILGLSRMGSSNTLARIFPSDASLHSTYQAHGLRGARSQSFSISSPSARGQAQANSKSPEKLALALSPRRVGRVSNLRACAMNAASGTVLDPIPSERSSLAEEMPGPFSIGSVLAGEGTLKSFATGNRASSRDVTPPATATTSATVSPLDPPTALGMPLSSSVTTSMTCSPVSIRITPPRSSARPSTRPSVRPSVRLSGMDYPRRTSAYSYIPQPHSPHLPPRSSQRFSLWSPPSMEKLRFGSTTRPTSTICSPPRSAIQSRRASVLRRLSALTSGSPDVGRSSVITSPEMARLASPPLQPHHEEEEYSGNFTYLDDVVPQPLPDPEIQAVDVDLMTEIKSAHQTFVMQIVLFVIGFLMPLCWFAGAVLPLPNTSTNLDDECANCPECLAEQARLNQQDGLLLRWKRLLRWGRKDDISEVSQTPHSSHSDRYFRSQGLYDRQYQDGQMSDPNLLRVGDGHYTQPGLASKQQFLNDTQVSTTAYSPEATRLLLKAKWWQMINRIMSVVGVLLIGAVVGIAVAAREM